MSDPIKSTLLRYSPITTAAMPGGFGLKIALAPVAILGLGYAAFLLCGINENVQRFFFYANWLRIPFGTDYSAPTQFLFAPSKVQSFSLTTPDNETLAAWHVLPDSYYNEVAQSQPVPAAGPFSQQVYDEALRRYPTVLYCHGNSATRAVARRVTFIRYLSSLNVNVIAFDYRGFAESSGTPSEEGIAIDARAFWDFLTLTKGIPSHDITLVGQSLGTGVVSRLTKELALEKIHPKSVVLVAAFSTWELLMDTYCVLGIVPVLSPLIGYPRIHDWWVSKLTAHFPTIHNLAYLNSPLLIIHGDDDQVVHASHSRLIFNTLLDQSGFPESAAWEPKAPLGSPVTQATQKDERDAVVHEPIGDYGSVHAFRMSRQGKDIPVVWLQGRYGQHDLSGQSDTALLYFHMFLQ